MVDYYVTYVTMKTFQNNQLSRYNCHYGSEKSIKNKVCVRWGKKEKADTMVQSYTSLSSSYVYVNVTRIFVYSLVKN